ncbi:hypothetical protein Dtox_0016 [Desulfofarcimen acetoxidans DSM 771]|uniref:Uncharacterized protein n=1 Tax=Desulfofarcimen acetoxidans (strain ATCC 49208 / DSM 771 / KCTC 5769 / VKM B-1644 / 5575) TaxID=485916 RepID=C8VVB1_DESAS|nr:hypothetical protein Dtox_0016 [Desulfofarcimen acetoxidans DSM 771]
MCYGYPSVVTGFICLFMKKGKVLLHLKIRIKWILVIVSILIAIMSGTILLTDQYVQRIDLQYIMSPNEVPKAMLYLFWRHMFFLTYSVYYAQ